jgi:hypothetical protein
MTAALESRLKSATTDLLGYDDENLIEELGRRGKALQLDFSEMGNPDMQPTEDPSLLGPMDEIRDLGLRIAKRWIREVHQVVCSPDAVDKEDRDKIQSAFQLKGSDLAAALAAFLVSSFFVASPVATVVAAIVVKRLGNSALEEICKKSDEWIKQMK